MPKPIRICPFQKLDLRNCLGPQPDAFLHLLSRQAFTPKAADVRPVGGRMESSKKQEATYLPQACNHYLYLALAAIVSFRLNFASSKLSAAAFQMYAHPPS